MKQTLIPVQLLTIDQVQQIIGAGQDALVDAVSKKSNIDSKNLVVRMLNPRTDLMNTAYAPGLGSLTPMRLGDGAVMGHGNENLGGQPDPMSGFMIQNRGAGAIPRGTFVDYIPEFTIPADRGIVIVGIIDEGQDGGPGDGVPIVETVKILTGGTSVIDQWNCEDLEQYMDSDMGTQAFAQTQFPFIDQDLLHVQMSFKRDIPGNTQPQSAVKVQLVAYVVEKYGKVISQKTGTTC